MQRTLKYHIFETLDSTQVWAKQLKKESLKIHAVHAFEQTKGQGTFGKTWVSPKNTGLYVTYAFEVGHKEHISSLSHLAACAVCMSIDPIEPKIKWPNDIFVKGKKISGVLTEVIDNHVYIGIGINLEFDAKLKNVQDQPVTAYSDHKTPPRLEDLLEYLSNRVLELIHLWDQSGFQKIKPIYEKYFGLLNHKVIIDTNEGLLSGILIGFSDEGYPILKKNTEIFTITHLGHINLDEP